MGRFKTHEERAAKKMRLVKEALACHKGEHVASKSGYMCTCCRKILKQPLLSEQKEVANG